MPTCEWVLDTWLLEIAQDPCDRRSLDALALLHEIKAQHRIAVDYRYRILGEYFRHVKGNSHAGHWLRATVDKAEKTVWRAGNVPSRNRAELLNDLRFDTSDLVFVGVAAEGPDRLIVSEERDYSQQVKVYLARELGVNVLSVSAALERARDP